MEKARTAIRFYEDEFVSSVAWGAILRQLGVPKKELGHYYTVLLSVDGYSFDTGTEFEKEV